MRNRPVGKGEECMKRRRDRDSKRDRKRQLSKGRGRESQGTTKEQRKPSTYAVFNLLPKKKPVKGVLHTPISEARSVVPLVYGDHIPLLQRQHHRDPQVGGGRIILVPASANTTTFLLTFSSLWVPGENSQTPMLMERRDGCFKLFLGSPL